MEDRTSLKKRGMESLLQKQEGLLILSIIPLLLLSPALANAQGYAATTIQGKGQEQTRPAQFVNLGNTTWTLYNESSGSTSIMKFNSNDTYTRNLHGNNLTGNWQSSIVTEQQVQLCPTEPKWTSGCILVGLRIENPHSIGFMDSHGDRMHLMR
jgi:hypothetical protein